MKNLKKLVAVTLALLILPLCSLLFYKNTENKTALFSEKKNKVIYVDTRDYIIGALACEMPASFHTEALKAQAVAIYTNAVRSQNAGEQYVCKINENELLGYTTAKILKQKWGKTFDTYYKKLADAVDSVYKSVITYDSKPILAAYHSLSAGKTENAENVWGQKVPYLVSRESDGDTFCSELTSTKTFTVKEAREILSTAFPDTFLPQVDSLLMTNINKSDAGTVLSLVVGDKEVTGQKIRSLFSLKSACFDAKIAEGSLTFTTYGYGHGVGLSQYGADFMARQGKTYKEILKHYYNGTEIMYTK